eukprot:1176084-Prorocentrum_minimum.AAC.1
MITEVKEESLTRPNLGGEVRNRRCLAGSQPGASGAARTVHRGARVQSSVLEAKVTHATVSTWTGATSESGHLSAKSFFGKLSCNHQIDAAIAKYKEPFRTFEHPCKAPAEGVVLRCPLTSPPSLVGVARRSVVVHVIVHVIVLVIVPEVDIFLIGHRPREGKLLRCPLCHLRPQREKTNDHQKCSKRA